MDVTPLSAEPGTVTHPESTEGPSTASVTARVLPSSSTAPLASGNPGLHRRSCELCRHRRVKCDRQQPCSNCVRAKADCVYPSGRGRAPKTSRRALDALLVDRLSHLETLVRSLGDQPSSASHNDPADSHSAPAASRNSGLLDPSGSIEGQLGRLMVNDSRSYYMSNVLWTSLVSEVQYLPATHNLPA